MDEAQKRRHEEPPVILNESDIWDDLISDYQERSTLHPDEMTGSILAEQKGISVRVAAAILRSAFDRGELEQREVRLPGMTYPVKAYKEKAP